MYDVIPVSWQSRKQRTRKSTKRSAFTKEREKNEYVEVELEPSYSRSQVCDSII